MKKWLAFLVLPIIFTLIVILVPPIFVRPVAVDKSLVGVGLFIDPGHGGYDPGSNRDQVLEKDINLDIASSLFELTLERGAITFMTRSGDYDLSHTDSTNHKAEDLRERVRAINQSGANLLVSLHLNALSDPDVRGPMVYYREKDPVSKKLAFAVQDRLNEMTGLDKIIHSERYYLFRKTTLPAILVECGFLSNSAERRQLLDPKYQQRLARAIFLGIEDFWTLGDS